MQYATMLDEEIFFFMYHLHRSETEAMAFEPYRRKWMIHRFVEQKKKENEEIEKVKRQAQQGKAK